MSVRWQERKYEDDLLKRELVLRLLEEHYGTSGGLAPATDRFYLRARRMMLRHPLFAVRYALFALDLAVGRLQDRVEDCEFGDADAEPTIAAGPTLEFERRSQPLPVRGIRIRRRDGRVVAVSVMSAPERRLTAHVHPSRVCRNWRSALHLQLGRLHERVLAAGRLCASALVFLAAGLARQLAATLVELVGKLSRQRLVLRARLVRLERASRSARADLAAEVRRARRLFVAQGIHAGRLGQRAVAPATRCMLRRRILYVRLLRRSHDLRAELHLQRTSKLALTALGTHARRQRQVVARRVAALSRIVVAVPRPRWEHRPRNTTSAALAAILVAAVGAIAIVWTHVSGPSRGIPRTAFPERLSPLLPSRHPPRAVSIPTSPARRRNAAKRVEHPTRPKKDTHLPQTVLVADTVPTTSLPPTAPRSVAAQNDGPAPLPAPTGNSAPSPLKAP